MSLLTVIRETDFEKQINSRSKYQVRDLQLELSSQSLGTWGKEGKSRCKIHIKDNKKQKGKMRKDKLALKNLNGLELKN